MSNRNCNLGARVDSSKLMAAIQRRPRQALCETLEDRRLFAAVFPTAIEQFELQIVNRMRANPVAEVQRLAADPDWEGTPDLNEGVAPGTFGPEARQPLAWNPNLGDAARKHSQFMLDNNVFDHVVTINGVRTGPTERVVAAGYVLGPGRGAGENLARTITRGDEETALNLHSLLFIDSGITGRGHRVALLNGGSNEVGFGIAAGTFDNLPFSMLTQNYANAGNGSFLLGVAIQDLNSDKFYQPGEGLGGVTITATRTSDNQVFTTTTWDAGGYSLKLDPGTYNVTATGGNIGTPGPQAVTIGTQNVAADFIKSGGAQAAPVIVTHPQNTRPGLSATTFSFSVTATGNPTPTVQWQSAPFQSNNFTDIPGATGFTLTQPIAPQLNGNQYRAVVNNSQGTVTSNAASLSVQNGATLPITVTERPKDQTVNVGETVTFTVAGTGFTSVSWAVQTAAGAFSVIPGATTTTLTFTAEAAQNGNTYFARLQNDTGGQDIPARLTVNAAPTPPVVVTQPDPAPANNGGQGNIDLVTNGFPEPDFDWQTFNPDDDTWGPWEPFDPNADAFTDATPRALSVTVPLGTSGQVNGTTFTFPVTAADHGRLVRAVISNGEGSVTTDPIRLTVNKKSVITNDRKALDEAIQAALAAVEECRKLTAAHIRTLAKDLKRLDASDDAKAKLRTLAADEKVSRLAFLRNQKALFAQLRKLAANVDADAKRLARDPSDTALQAELQQSLAALQAAADGSTAPADAVECKLSQIDALQALLAATPEDAELRTHINAAVVTANDVGQALHAPVAIAQNIVARLVDHAQA